MICENCNRELITPYEDELCHECHIRDTEEHLEYEELQRIIELAIGPNCIVEFSAYKQTTLGTGEIVNNLNDIAFRGWLKFHQQAFCDEGKDYTSEVVKDPTWLDICKLANQMLLRTKDYRIFLEGIERCNFPSNPNIYYATFIMGS